MLNMKRSEIFVLVDKSGNRNTEGLDPSFFFLYNYVTVLHKTIMTVTTNEYGQQNMFAKEPQMVVESYNRKGLESPQQYAETYNGRWAMMGIISGFISYAITGKFFFGIF